MILWTAVLLWGGQWLLSGCGYHAGSLIPADVHSVGIRVAQNETFWHEAVKVDNLPQGQPLPVPRPAYTMEVEFTEQLKDEVVRRTPLKVLPEEKADTVLITRITKITPTVLVRDANDNVLAERVAISVDFTWQDRRSGRVIAEGKGVTRPTDYMTARGETFTTAARTNFYYISLQIVEQMQESF
jgi:hypothetical protein